MHALSSIVGIVYRTSLKAPLRTYRGHSRAGGLACGLRVDIRVQDLSFFTSTLSGLVPLLTVDS